MGGEQTLIRLGPGAAWLARFQAERGEALGAAPSEPPEMFAARLAHSTP